MAGKNELERQSDKAAYVALWFLIPVSLFVVTGGWQKLISNFILIPSIPFLQGFLQYGLAFFVAAMGIVLAKAVAIERRRIKQNKNAEARFTWLAYFAVLVAISALGTINMIFGLTETPTYIKETALRTEASLSQLNQAIQTRIVTVEYDRKRSESEANHKSLNDTFEAYQGMLKEIKDATSNARERQIKQVEDVRDKFIREVNNPANPGLGTEARKVLEEIIQKLPELTLPSGDWTKDNREVKLKSYVEAINAAKDLHFSELNCVLTGEAQQQLIQIKQTIPKINLIMSVPCDKIDAHVASIQEDIKAHIISSVPQISAAEQERVDFRRSASEVLERHVASMRQLYSDLALLNKETASPLLKDAWIAYADNRRTADAYIEGGIPELPEQIEDEMIDKLGNILSTIQILISRLDHPATYLIIIAGLLFDLVLISFYGRHLSSIEVKKDNFAHLPSVAPTSRTTQNLFDE